MLPSGMSPLPGSLLFGLGAALCTLMGGVFALRHEDRLHLILGLSAGAVMAVALLDLLQEAVDLGAAAHSSLTIMAVAVAGSLAYMCLDRGIHPAERGHLGAASLTLHSFLDGLAIGLSMQVSFRVGLPVALAVLAHDFSDGLNTVNVSLVGGVPRAGVWRWLLADALAPVAGVVAGSLFRLQPPGLSLILAAFAGFFVYIGWSELSPESYHRHPRLWTTLSTLIGSTAIYLIIRLAG